MARYKMAVRYFSLPRSERSGNATDHHKSHVFLARTLTLCSGHAEDRGEEERRLVRSFPLAVQVDNG